MWRRISDLLGPSPWTGQQGETEFRNDSTKPKPQAVKPYPRDYSVAEEQAPQELYFVATPLWVLVADEGSHDDLFNQLSWQRSQPNAFGKLNLHYRWDALWEIEQNNMAVEKLEKALKQYTKDQGWNWQGMVDRMGDHLSGFKYAEYPGIGEINPGVKDWRNKEWGDPDMHDSIDVRYPSDYPGFTSPDEIGYGNDQGEPSGFVCSECGYPAENYADWRGHIMREHVHKSPVDTTEINDEHWLNMPSGAEPVVDLDDALPAHWDKLMLDQTDMRQASLRRCYAMIKQTQGAQPQIQGPLPFIFDIEQDRIYVGHPGERHSDINARLTPGGIVEGIYDPKGNVQLRTETDMPYTVKHLIQLWYSMHPELEVKGVHLLVGEEKYRLAKISRMSSKDIGHKVRAMAATDPAAWDAYQALRHFGQVYVVGGAVRDIILGKTPKDFDLLVQGVPPEEVQEVLERLPGHVDVTGKLFGVFRYRDPDGYETEVALPRREHSTGEGHRDFDVQSDHMMPVEEDLSRRDFTANSLAVNLDTGELIDPYHGSQDIKARELKTVSDKSLEEDPLRMLRVLTAISRHQLIPTREVLEQIKKNAYRVQHLPAERVQAELDKMIRGEDPALAVRLLEETGLFKEVLPEYDRTRGFDQKNPHHTELLHDHMKSVLRNIAEQSHDPDLRWAGFLHDIGKPRSLWMDENGVGHYYKNKFGHGDDHWSVGAEMARDRLSKLKFPNNRIDRITHLIEHHMFPKFSGERGARKFINKVGPEHTDDLLTLRAADIAGRERVDDVGQMRSLVHKVQSQGQPTSIRQLAINGNDLINAGWVPGPEIGSTLRYLTEQVIENPELNDPATLLEMANQTRNFEKQSNILDAIHSSLDPTVFNNPDSPMPQVKPQVSRFVRKKIYSTLKEQGWPDPEKIDYLSLVLTGSLTTYQYSDKSDFDTSLWIDAAKLPEWVRADLIKMMIENCDGTVVPGTTHPMQCFVVDVNRYSKTDLYRPGLRSAYDLDTGIWLVPPDKSRSVDVDKLYHSSLVYAHGIVDKLKLCLKYGNNGAVKILWDFIHKQRHRDMAAGKGDWSEWNITVKLISNEGLLPEISKVTGEHIA